jgi:hypothetical protein
MERVTVRMVLWLGNLMERNNTEDLDVDGKNVLRGILKINLSGAVVYPEIFFGGGSTNSVEDRENGDLGAVAP